MFFYINYVSAVTVPKRWELWSYTESAAEEWKQHEWVSFTNLQFWHISMVSIIIFFVLICQLKNTVIFTKNSKIMYKVTNCIFKLNVSQRFFCMETVFSKHCLLVKLRFDLIWLHPEEACHKWDELPHLPACSPPNPRTPERGEWKGLRSGWPVLHLKVDFHGDCKGTGQADRAGHYFLCYICIPWRKNKSASSVL